MENGLAIKTDNTRAEQIKPWQFKPGQSGNPKGRPKGARNKLSERFLFDMMDLWESKGMQILADVAEKQPEKVLSAMVQVLPKDFQVSVTDENQVRWVIDAKPMSVQAWQDSVLPNQCNTKTLDSKTCDGSKQTQSKQASAGDCVALDLDPPA